jgi:excisionase family DNA binding protein
MGIVRPARLDRFLAAFDTLLRELDRRDALLAELRTSGLQRTQAEIDATQARADDILARCRSVQQRLSASLLTAAQDDPALYPLVERLREIPPLLPSNARLIVFRLRAFVEQTLAMPSLQTRQNPPATPKGLLTAKQVAAEIGLSDKTVYRLARDGRIPYVRIQGSLRFRPADVKAWLEAKTFRPKRP